MAGKGLGGMAEAAVEVMDERKQRCFDHRHEKVLRGEAYDDPEGYVRPGLQLEPKVADNAPGACARSSSPASGAG